MMNSGLLRPKVVYLMFGHYALLIDQCDAFWMGLERESRYWIVFRGFIQEMERVGRRFERSDKTITGRLSSNQKHAPSTLLPVSGETMSSRMPSSAIASGMWRTFSTLAANGLTRETISAQSR